MIEEQRGQVQFSNCPALRPSFPSSPLFPRARGLTAPRVVDVLADMPDTTLWSIEASSAQGMLRVFEPTQAEILAAAAQLAVFNNDSHNAGMMTNTRELTANDIVEFYQSLRAHGGHPFLLEQDGVLMGDADFRNVLGSGAEFAIMVGARSEQNRGLGTRFAVMAHVAAWRVLRYQCVSATIIPKNFASLRLVEKLGYLVDESSYAASLRESEDDIVMSIDWHQFEQSHGEFLQQVVVTERNASP